MGMTEKSEFFIKSTEKWITKHFPEARWFRHDELVLDNTVYMWVIDLFYLHMVLGFNDLDYKFSASYEVLMEEEDNDDLIVEDFDSMEYGAALKALEESLEKHKNRISVAKYLVETIRNQEHEQATIDMVNKMIEDSGV